jgi:hypothetical protein
MNNKSFDEFYWNYTIKSEGQSETWINGKFEVVGSKFKMLDYDANNVGKYSTLKSAIQGFINDELNPFSKITVKKYENESSNKFKIITDVYVDYMGKPVNDVIKRRWEQGKIEHLTHVFIEAIFIKHQNEQASFSDLNELTYDFPNFNYENFENKNDDLDQIIV